MGLETAAWWHLFVFSGVGACVAEVCTMPLDVTKTRLQLSRTSQGTRAPGLARSLLQVASERGPAGLWSGLSPALLRQATYGSARIGLYEPAKRALASARGRALGAPRRQPAAPSRPEPSPLVDKLLAGTMSGALASAAFNPTDRVKVLLQAPVQPSAGRPSGRRGAVAVAREVVRSEGFAGLYRGWGPTATRAALVAAAELATYDEFKARLLDWGLEGGASTTHLAASGLAGLVAAAVSSPADVVKSRVMADPARYPGFASALTTTLREEGPSALYRGFVPNAVRIVPHVCIGFVVLERLRAWAS